MEKDIHDYVARRIQEIKQELEESKKRLQEAEDRVYYEEALMPQKAERLKDQLHELGWTEKAIEAEVMAHWDAEEDWIDNFREKATECRNRVFALENDLVIYENFGR